MTAEESALSFNHVSFRYEPHDPLVAKDVTFSVPKGSFTVIVGPSGSGKSTLLRLALKLDTPTAGSVESSGTASMVFQNGALLPWRTALQNVLIGLTGAKMTRAAKERHAHRALTLLGIGEFADRYPREVSGGQRQRIGIARALVSEPEILYLDEPFSALDAETTRQLAEELLTLHSEEQITMLMISHSIEDAVLLADRVLVFKEGVIAHEVPISIPHPRHPEDANIATLVARVKGLLPSRS